jgi:hypothetical protein
MNVVNWVSNSSAVEMNSRKGKSVLRVVDTDALEKFGHARLLCSDIQVAFVCPETTFVFAKRVNSPSEPAYFTPRIALSLSNGTWGPKRRSKD